MNRADDFWRTARDWFVMAGHMTEDGQRMDKANDRQEGGDHYKTPIQMWDFLLANGVPWLEGTIMCYVFRHRAKNGLADLRKAKHCLEKLIEVEEAKIVGNG